MLPETSEAARAAVQRLQEEWDWPDPSLVREIAAQGEAAVAPLIDLLTPDVIERSELEGRESALVYYVIHLLGETHSPAAIPALIHLFSALDRDDDLNEALPDALLRLGRPEAIDPLLDVLADESLSWYPRASAAEAAGELAGTDPARRAKIAEAVRPLLAERVRRAAPVSSRPQLTHLPGDLFRRSPLSDDDTDLVAELVATLADVNDLQARPLIDSAFRAGLVNTSIIDPDYVEELYADGGKTDYRTPADWLERYERDYEKHLQEDAEPEDESEAAQRLRDLEEDWEPVQEPIVLGKRLGRNDPCWCGSGKKYKKCHLAADEKEGRA